MSASPTRWPPPPDLASLRELTANADVEGFIADGAPADEYDTEAALLFDAIGSFAVADLTPGRLLPLLQAIWRESFSLDPNALEERLPGLESLSAQIARFFGPEAQPLTRGGPLLHDRP